MPSIDNWIEARDGWRMNYGIVKGDPMAAYIAWKRNGSAPIGAVVALGLCIDEVDRIAEEVERLVRKTSDLTMEAAMLESDLETALKDVERLRKLCAERPKSPSLGTIPDHLLVEAYAVFKNALDVWHEKIDEASNGDNK